MTVSENVGFNAYSILPKIMGVKKQNIRINKSTGDIGVVQGNKLVVVTDNVIAKIEDILAQKLNKKDFMRGISLAQAQAILKKCGWTK